MTTAYKQHTVHCSCRAVMKQHYSNVERLTEKVEELETEVASVRLAGVVCLERAEGQLAEAVGRFILAVNEEAEADMKRGNPLEGAHHRALEKLGSPFLAGLSTVTPEDCERVFAGYGVAGIGYKCSRHGCDWPDEGGECPWNTPPPGRPVALSGPRPVGGSE